MTRRVKYSVYLCAFTILAAAGHTLVARAASDGADKPACEALREWARPYEGTQPTLSELARFDRAHRIAIFNAVTPEVRSALWQEQMTRFSERADLSSTQRDLIAEARTILTPSLYRRDQTAQRVFEQVRPRLEAAFTSAEHRRAWFELASVIPTPSGAEDAPSDRSNSLINGTALGLSCNCYSQEPVHNCNQAPCIPGGCSTHMGCGFGGLSWCNGRCGSR